MQRGNRGLRTSATRTTAALRVQHSLYRDPRRTYSARTARDPGQLDEQRRRSKRGRRRRQRFGHISGSRRHQQRGGDERDRPGDCSFNTETAAHPLKQTVEATVTPDYPTTAPYAQRITIEMQQFVNTVGWETVQQETADTISPTSDYITSASMSTGCLPGLWRGHFTVH